MNARDLSLIERIDALLPQTQCRKCGYAGCRPYAEAIASGAADVDRCPPGGDDGARALARLLGVEPKPVDRRFGAINPPVRAMIEESRCIGCTLCIQACPVDAIVGAAKVMHTVLREACTGCELCLPPCPVDCITLVEVPARAGDDELRARAAARQRFNNRNARMIAAPPSRKERAELAAERKKREIVARALERARQRLSKRD